MYSTRIISRSLYIFTPFFTSVYNQETDNLCTKQGNSSKKIRGFKSRAGYYGACMVEILPLKYTFLVQNKLVLRILNLSVKHNKPTVYKSGIQSRVSNQMQDF